MGQTEIDIETLLHWAYRDELSKRQTSSAEGIWDRILEDGQRGGVDKGHGAAQRYSHFGLPDPDAELIEKAVSTLGDLVIDWKQSFDAIAAELSGLITINEVAPKRESPLRMPIAGWGPAGAKAVKAMHGETPRQVHDRPRDVIMVGGLRTSVLVTAHAVKGTRPDWFEESPKPRPTPAQKGPNAAIFGECKGRNLYSLGAYCPLIWNPSPLSIVSSRAEYVAWHDGLTQLAKTLRLAKFTPLPPKASRTPWLTPAEPRGQPIQIRPEVKLSTLPLAPDRGRKTSPLRNQRFSAVRYPLEGEVA